MKNTHVAQIIAVGPSLTYPANGKDTYYEAIRGFTTCADFEKQMAFYLREPTFSVSDLIWQATVDLDLLRKRNIARFKRPYQIVARYGSWDDLIKVDAQQLCKEIKEDDEAAEYVENYMNEFYARAEAGISKVHEDFEEPPQYKIDNIPAV